MLTLKRVRLRWERGSVDFYRLHRNEDFVDSFCKKEFERLTGIKLKPNETREIKSIKITLKPARKKAKK